MFGLRKHQLASTWKSIDYASYAWCLWSI